MENILVLCAHPDDEVFGIGGTIAKYVREGRKVTTVVFSYGEMAMPWLKPEEVRKIRKKETLEASKILGTKTFFLGLKEGKIDKMSRKKRDFVESLVKKLSPSKIFTHAPDDPHFDHRAVHVVVMDMLKSIGFKGDIYLFDVWNILTLKKRHVPKLYVNITKEFKLKLEATKKFETQKIQGRWPLIPAIIIRALFFGFLNHCRYAERFRKVETE